METVINMRTCNPEDMERAIYIGRPHGDPNQCYGNPFTHIPLKYTAADISVPTRELAVDAYEQWLRGTQFGHVQPQRRAWILANLASLQGKTLMCHCAPKPCHGDVLIKLMHEQLDTVVRQEALDRDYDIDETLADERSEAQYNTDALRRGELE